MTTERPTGARRPPEPTGKVLCRLDRPSSEGRAAARLFLTLEEYNGNPYFRLSLWEMGRFGWWWPVRGRTITVRISEADQLADAIRDAALQAGQGRMRRVAGRVPGGRAGVPARRDGEPLRPLLDRDPDLCDGVS